LPFDKELLMVWNFRLTEYGKRIHSERKKFIEKLIPVFQKYYTFISQGNEQVELIHKSDLYDKELEQLLTESLIKDRAAQYTTVGIHKDELIFNLDQYPIKKLGSQGQN